MSILIIVSYQDIHKAEEISLQLVKLQTDFLLTREDAIVVVKTDKGKVKVHQAFNLKDFGAMSGVFWGGTDWIDVP